MALLNYSCVKNVITDLTLIEAPTKIHLYMPSEGVQWLSGRVLDMRPRGRGFLPLWHHCVVVLELDTFILA